jgi:putative transcriptional regulator
MIMEEIKQLFNFNKLNSLSTEKGRILISDPFLNDDYFSNSVILLCESNEKRAFGLILNHYIDEELSDLMTKFTHINTSEFKISLGGPVDTDSIYYIHNRPDLIEGSINVFDNLYLGNGDNFDAIADLINSNKIIKNEIKFFLGYSGWTDGQLSEELERNSWFVGNLSAKTIMEYHETDIWKKTLEKMSEKHRVISNFPQNPMLN